MREEKHIFSIVENGMDMILNIAAFYLAFIISVAIEPPTLFLNEIRVQLMIFVAVMLASFNYQIFNLYRPVSSQRENYFISATVLANIVFFAFALIGAVLLSPYDERIFMMVWVPITAVVSTALLVMKKKLIITVVRFLQKRRYIVKKVIVIGDNVESSRFFIKQVEKDTGLGFMLLGGVGRKLGADSGLEKLGDFEDLEQVLDKYRPDYAVFAVGYYDKQHLISMVNMCDDRCIKVYFLPVIYGFFKSAKQVERIGEIPIINVHSTPLDNRFNAFVKRAIDIAGSLALILLTSPIMIAAAIGVAISSPGPIFFKQERVGKMGKSFTMFKFRSMHVNDKSDVGWTTDEDPRKTKFGNFIRRTSIDELPQLFNVLRGDMSLVGPRPEIPHFVEYFKHRIPLYMVKHYVKPGMTGLAQIKGLRGDTSVEERIEEDISYIERWSLLLDIIILLKTPFKTLNKHEKYAARERAEQQNSAPVSQESAENTVNTNDAAQDDEPK